MSRILSIICKLALIMSLGGAPESLAHKGHDHKPSDQKSIDQKSIDQKPIDQTTAITKAKKVVDKLVKKGTLAASWSSSRLRK